MVSRARLAPAVVLALLCVSSAAHAQGKNDAAAAEALFNDGKRLMGAGQYSAACPKFAESQRLDPGIGTMLWLGDCYAKNGQIASAWATFHEAEAAAAKQKDPRVGVAREEAQKYEPRMSKVVLDVSAVSTVPDLQVKRDGVVLGKPLWGTPIPTDGGDHVIVASAPLKKPWQTTISVPNEDGSLVVKIPPLADAPPPPPSEAVRPDPNTGRTQRIVGIVLAGAGVVGLGLGGYFGLSVDSKNDEATGRCDANNVCDAIGYKARSDALDLATYSDIAFIAGGVALAGGAVVFLTAPKASRTLSVGGGPLLGNGAGTFLRGRF